MAKREQTDREKNRFSARAARYARVSANVGGVAARYAGRRLLGGEPDHASEASALSLVLGRLKGPLMKVAQLMATIPDLLAPAGRTNSKASNTNRRPLRRLAKSTARSRSTATRSPASCNILTCSPRSK